MHPLVELTLSIQVKTKQDVISFGFTSKNAQTGEGQILQGTFCRHMWGLLQKHTSIVRNETS